MSATGTGFTVTLNEDELLHPLDVIVTVYVPELLAPAPEIKTESDDDWKLSGPFHSNVPAELVTLS
jgi:hypothetical protein